MADKKGTKKKKERNTVTHGVMHVQASFNNTIITISDKAGNVLAWSTAGANGFKGSRKSTPFAAQVAADAAVKKAASTYGVKFVDVRVNGPGAGREAALRAIQSTGVRVSSIKDVTPVPHNGCRPPNRRRV